MPIRTRHTGKAIRYIRRWKDDERMLKSGILRNRRHFTVVYWYKGDPGATWVKADICYPNGKLAMSAVLALAQNLQDLKRRVPEDLEYFGLR